MKEKLLDDHIQTIWSGKKNKQVAAMHIRDAAIRQGHIERSIAFIQFKDDLKCWLLTASNFVSNRFSSSKNCSV